MKNHGMPEGVAVQYIQEHPEKEALCLRIDDRAVLLLGSKALIQSYLSQAKNVPISDDFVKLTSKAIFSQPEKK